MMEKARAARAAAHLRGLIRMDGTVMTRAGMVDTLLKRGAVISVVRVDKVKPMSRTAFFRADNATQRAHEERIRTAGKRPEYRATLPDGTFWELTKTQYEYARREAE